MAIPSRKVIVTTRTLAALAVGVCLIGARPQAVEARDLKDGIAPFSQSLMEQLRARKFAELEQTESQLRKTKARFPGGDWQLHHFYEALGGGLIQSNSVAIQSDWTELIDLLKEWRTASPQSGVPALLLAATYTKYGWDARTSKRPEQVSQSQFDTFHDRLNQGAFYLNEGRRLLSDNPHWFVIALQIARGQGWEKSRTHTLFNQAVALEPLYQHSYSMMALYLLPRWYGDEGEWEIFADEATGRVGGQPGSAIYHHIIVRMSQMHEWDEMFGDNDVTWARIQSSFAAREQLYGEGREAVNAMCWLAGAAGDTEAARALMKRIDGDWDQNVWRTRQRFDDYQKWLKRP